jgi:tRNA dimethylallyltransferase
MVNKAVESRRDLTSELPVVVILGATATGKTGLSIRVAQEFDGEVVNADSRYLYRGMDIGTAKPTEAERDGVTHHLIDIVDPWDGYSLSRFLRDAYAAVEDVGQRGGLPVVTGGTPQYLRAFVEGWSVPEVAPDAKLRAELEAMPTDKVFARLQSVDPVSAERIGPHNKRRMIRAVEIQQVTGRPMSDVAGHEKPPYRFLLLGLRQNREQLRARIDLRVVEMFSSGWLDEVRRLHELGVTAATPAMSAHGYREALEVVQGQADLDDAIRRTQLMVHRYVRHQETWFRKFSDINWFDSGEPGFEAAAVALVRGFLSQR